MVLYALAIRQSKFDRQIYLKGNKVTCVDQDSDTEHPIPLVVSYEEHGYWGPFLTRINMGLSVVSSACTVIILGAVG